MQVSLYCDSFFYREPTTGCDLDLVMSWDLDCLPLDWPAEFAQVVCPKGQSWLI